MLFNFTECFLWIHLGEGRLLKEQVKQSTYVKHPSLSRDYAENDQENLDT